MHSVGETTGTSAVNERGDVIVFVGPEWRRFADFDIDGAILSLRDAKGGSLSRTYGPLTVEAARLAGRIDVVELGLDSRPRRRVTVRRRDGC